MITDPIRRLLDEYRTVVLDGGLATQLERAGADLSDPLWSARLLLDDPSLVFAAHVAYFEAGADLAISASYQASFEGFAARGIDERDAAALLRRSVQIARAARDAFWGEGHEGRPRPLVAASIGPYGAVLANGAEYTGDYGIDTPALARFHARRLDVLAAPETGADLLAIETIPSLREAEAVVRALEGRTAPAWMSFTCRDAETLADGSPFSEAVAVAAAAPSVVAVGVNCTAPSLIAPLVAVAATAGRPVVAYPNRGARWDAGRRRWIDAGEITRDLAARAPDWVAAGARLVGGCCGTGPGDIREIAATLGRTA